MLSSGNFHCLCMHDRYAAVCTVLWVCDRNASNRHMETALYFLTNSIDAFRVIRSFANAHLCPWPVLYTPVLGPSVYHYINFIFLLGVPVTVI